MLDCQFTCCKVLTALVRKSRCAWVKGLDTGAGLAAAAEPDFGIRAGSEGASKEALWVVDIDRRDRRV